MQNNVNQQSKQTMRERETEREREREREREMEERMKTASEIKRGIYDNFLSGYNISYNSDIGISSQC